MRIIYPLVLALVFLQLQGCAFARLSKELLQLSNSIVLIGTIVTDQQVKGRIVVVAYRDHQGEKVIADYQSLIRPGPYGFILPRGDYHLFAFEDRNQNRTYDQGEPVGQYHEAVRAPTAITEIENLKITISAQNSVPENLIRNVIDTGIPQKPFTADLGAVADLDNPIFSRTYGEKGLWEPLTFIQEVRGGVFFLDQYDQNKIPILFVHGAGGTPRDWDYFFKHLDQTQYQPWFYYYPSGLPIDVNAYWLNRIVEALHEKYQFQRLYVTAHSMGGLVAFRFINMNVDISQQDYIKLFVSLSTPWGGVPSAAMGLKYAPTVIPSWEDLAPKSAFFHSLYENPLPPSVKHYLFFSYKGSSVTIRKKSDGVITLASQLDPEIQARTTQVFGFDNDHAGILTSAEMFSRYTQVLNEVNQPESDAYSTNEVSVNQQPASGQRVQMDHRQTDSSR